MAPNYKDYSNLALARLRAEKWLALLFKPKNFSNIMEALDPNPNHGLFTKACQDAGIKDPNEIAWLWSYLEHCKAAVYGIIPEAASSGW